MKLGTYTFIWLPDNFTEPKSDKFYSKVRTYSSMAYFSWGADIVGKEISLTWDLMKEKDFQNIQSLVEDDEQKIWYPETAKRLYFGTVFNGPFVIGKSIAGANGAVGVISAVNLVENYVTFNAVTGTFINGEAIQDDSDPIKTATVEAVNILPNFDVEVFGLSGEYHEILTTNFVYRTNVELKLLIMSEADE